MREIIDNEAFLQKLVNILSEMLMVFEPDGTLVSANEAVFNTLMYENAEAIGTIERVFPMLFVRTGYGLECNEELDGHTISTVAYRSNNTCFEVEARFLKDTSGMGKFVCIASDISDKERLAREVSKAAESNADLTKVKDEFVAKVTHELRTPVNGILGNIQDLISREHDSSRLYTMEMIEKGCNDMNALINNILDFSKLKSGEFQMEDREFSLKNMIDYIRSNHINKVHEKGLDFFVTVAPDVPDKLVGDELRLEQILNNLLSNAIKFTTVGKILLDVVVTGRKGNKIELFFMVMDTGIGIAEQDMDKLFKGFSQVDASISRKYGGTGLGLNISKQLVNLMGGDISVDSTPGKGSTFTFSAWLTLPEGADETGQEVEYHVDVKLPNRDEDADTGDMTFGSPENREEIEKRLMKLILCIEMDTWEKAEMFSDAVKQLTIGAPKEVSREALKLKMAVQKENGEKASEAIDALRALL